MYRSNFHRMSNDVISYHSPSHHYQLLTMFKHNSCQWVCSCVINRFVLESEKKNHDEDQPHCQPLYYCGKSLNFSFPTEPSGKRLTLKAHTEDITFFHVFWSVTMKVSMVTRVLILVSIALKKPVMFGLFMAIEVLKKFTRYLRHSILIVGRGFSLSRFREELRLIFVIRVI